jgi:polar amino acid transport system substrate-binding protein
VIALLKRRVIRLYRYLSNNRIWLGLVSGILVLLLITNSGFAQEKKSPQTIRVATRVIPPFVLQTNGQLGGFSIEFWEAIAKQMKVESKFTVYPSVAQLLNSVESDKADLGVAAISITAERQKKFDFSLPMFASGLQVMVTNTQAGNNFPNLLQLFLSPGLLQVLGVALVLVLFAAHIIWLSERTHVESMIPTSYFPGIFKACWWAAATLATQADEMPKGVIGRFVAIIWMFIGVLFVAYFTAVATTSLTVQQLQGDIKSVGDLPGKVVATTIGSTAADYLRQKNIQVLQVPKIEQAYDALLNKTANAVVFDAPVLLYYAANEGKGKVEIVGSVFREENYAFVLPDNSTLRRSINSALLTLKENGTYQKLYDKWFKSQS